MTTTAPPTGARTATHEVTNQPPPPFGYDLSAEAPLTEGLAREGAGWVGAELAELGRLAGSEQAFAWAEQAHANPPELRTHDRYGHRVDEVRYHPAYHELMRVAVTRGLHAAPWAAEHAGAHVARAAKFYVWGQVEFGHGCPISMTYAAVPALRQQPELAADLEPLLASRVYDPGLRPALEKAGVTAGMAMTEKQGGSDVRANRTRATPVAGGGPGGEHRLTGHKWFCSAPMSDVFLVLAQAPGGLSCFLVPRVLPDGTRNPFLLQRLKDKCGNRSNASAEVELADTAGWLVGEEGRGVKAIIEMVGHTRLDCVIGSASLQRQALVQALHHASHREAFGARLLEQPLMRNVLADLAVESEAATALMLRLAGAVDRSHGEDADPHEQAVKRLGLAVGKYWVCKRTPQMVGEALECLGGGGYVEESGMPRLYREAPLNSIWEGTGNVQALDGLRALAREPETLEAYHAEVDAARGADARLDAAADALRDELAGTADAEHRARRLVERLATVLQGSLLVRHAPPAVADAFCASRLAGEGGTAFGTLPRSCDVEGILERAAPRW